MASETRQNLFLHLLQRHSVFVILGLRKHQGVDAEAHGDQDDSDPRAHLNPGHHQVPSGSPTRQP